MAGSNGNMNGRELSSDAHRRFAIYLGREKADEVANDVRTGEQTAAEAEEWSKQIETSYEASRHRPDIEPEDWQRFEEGWRPDGWNKD